MKIYRDEIFSNAVPLNDRPIPEFASDAGPSPLGTPSEEFLQGSVTVSFSVTNRGRVIEVEPVEVVPAEFTDMQKLVHREVRGRLYRPRFEEAEPVLDTARRKRQAADDAEAECRKVLETVEAERSALEQQATRRRLEHQLASLERTAEAVRE